MWVVYDCHMDYRQPEESPTTVFEQHRAQDADYPERPPAHRRPLGLREQLGPVLCTRAAGRSKRVILCGRMAARNGAHGKALVRLSRCSPDSLTRLSPRLPARQPSVAKTTPRYHLQAIGGAIKYWR